MDLPLREGLAISCLLRLAGLIRVHTVVRFEAQLANECSHPSVLGYVAWRIAITEVSHYIEKWPRLVEGSSSDIDVDKNAANACSNAGEVDAKCPFVLGGLLIADARQRPLSQSAHLQTNLGTYPQNRQSNSLPVLYIERPKCVQQ